MKRVLMLMISISVLFGGIDGLAAIKRSNPAKSARKAARNAIPVLRSKIKTTRGLPLNFRVTK